MGGLSPLHWIAIYVLFLVLIGIPAAQILRRVGAGPWWALLVCVLVSA